MGAKDVARYTTATAKFVVRIVAHAMVGHHMDLIALRQEGCNNIVDVSTMTTTRTINIDDT